MTTMLQSRHATRGKLVSRLQAEFGACRRERAYFFETARSLTSVPDHKAALPIINRKRPIAVLEMLNKLDKPFDSEDLDLLSRLVEQASIALERANLYKQASSLGITDELTKLYNSRYLEQVLDREVRRCRRYG